MWRARLADQIAEKVSGLVSKICMQSSPVIGAA